MSARTPIRPSGILEALALALISISVSTFIPSSSQANIFGNDERTQLINETLITQKIVKVITKFDGFDEGCTGALIGDNQVLTNRHCIFDDEISGDTLTRRSGRTSVYVGYNRGVSIDSAEAVSAIYGDGVGIDTDWAILTLDRPLGMIYGAFSVRAIPVRMRSFQLPVRLVAYHGDLPDSRYDETCSVMFPRDAIAPMILLQHNCDTAQGSSGAPILQCDDYDCWITGVNVAQKDPTQVLKRHPELKGLKLANLEMDAANLAVDAAVFQRAVQQPITLMSGHTTASK